MKSYVVTRDRLQEENLSTSEGLALALLSYLPDQGTKPGQIKRDLLSLNNKDIDEAEEALDNLRSEGYIRYQEGKWYITEDGKKLLESIKKSVSYSCTYRTKIKEEKI